MKVVDSFLFYFCFCFYLVKSFQIVEIKSQPSKAFEGGTVRLRLVLSGFIRFYPVFRSNIDVRGGEVGLKIGPIGNKNAIKILYPLGFVPHEPHISFQICKNL